MKQKIFMVLAAVILLLSLTLAGCAGGSTVTVTNTSTTTTTATTGVSQADYDSLQNQLTKAQSDKTAAEAEVTTMEAQVAALKAQYETTGLTTEEVVKKVTAQYYLSHYYDKDIYDCNNMASDLWDMFKKLGISSKIVIGDVDNQINDILASNHAWVLVEVSAGQFLALDATGGMAVTKTENPLYYRGWSFSDPAKLKQNDDLKTEYNTRVAFINTLVVEVNAAMNLYNNSSTQAEADKYLLLYNKLKDLKAAQESILLQVQAQINSLTNPL